MGQVHLQSATVKKVSGNTTMPTHLSYGLGCLCATEMELICGIETSWITKPRIFFTDDIGRTYSPVCCRPSWALLLESIASFNKAGVISSTWGIKKLVPMEMNSSSQIKEKDTGRTHSPECILVRPGRHQCADTLGQRCSASLGWRISSVCKAGCYWNKEKWAFCSCVLPYQAQWPLNRGFLFPSAVGPWSGADSFLRERKPIHLPRKWSLPAGYHLPRSWNHHTLTGTMHTSRVTVTVQGRAPV
jgi:hypothetical protein